MKENKIHREITPLSENECYVSFDRYKQVFTFPIHFHPEYELTFIENAKGSRRIVGDHISEIGNLELVLVGPNVYHGWENYKNNPDCEIHEITIQFSRDIFSETTLNKIELHPLQRLLNNAQRAISFSEYTILRVKKIVSELSTKKGFEGYLLLQTLLFELTHDNNAKLLTNLSFSEKSDFHNSERIEQIFNYIQNNYQKRITLTEIASSVNMTVVSFGRLMKQRTGKTFVDFINDIRIGYACRMLLETNKSISEICFENGFNNLSNFNRIFKKRQGLSPKEFRNSFAINSKHHHPSQEN